MFGAASGLSAQTIIEIVGSATALSVAAGAIYRRRIAATRTRWRSKDAVEGYLDDGGNWHPGLVDTVEGWRDREGRYHTGLIRRVKNLEHDQKRHRDDPTAHAR